MRQGIKSGSGGFGDGNLWLYGGLGLGGGAAIAYLGLPSYFSDGLLMGAIGFGVFMIAGAVLGMIIGSLLLRPDAGI